MSYNFVVTEELAQPVLSIRIRTAVGNLPQELGKGYQAIFQYLAEMGEKPLEAPFAAYYNMDMQDLDVEMGVPVANPLIGQGDIQPGEIPSGKRVSCVYKGPYDQTEPVYNAMMQ